MGLFERFLSLWVALAIVLGVTLGHFFPQLFTLFSQWEYARVNLLVAVSIFQSVNESGGG